ncbi:hypothetical protein SXANM310S_01531 [Streptomyces xanthochromogenes]
MPPQVATTLTTPAPMNVPYTPSVEASTAAATAASALPATWGTLRSMRFFSSVPESGLSLMPSPCSPFCSVLH